MGASSDATFFEMFPKDLFGEIPETISAFLVDSGFDRLVTLVTLVNDDIIDLEKENEVKLKLGHKRLLIQMVEYAKKKIVKLESEHGKAEKSAVFKSAEKIFKSKNRVKSQVNQENNTKEVLVQSINKTIKSFCRSNDLDSFRITDLDIMKSADGKFLAASIICICGGDVKVYPSSSSNSKNSITWVTSNMLRHLKKCHMPANNIAKITNFISVSKSSNVDENEDSTEEENMVGKIVDTSAASVLNLDGVQIIFNDSRGESSSSGEGTGNMTS